MYSIYTNQHSQYRPTTATQANEGPQQLMRDNEGQQRPTTANKRPTKDRVGLEMRRRVSRARYGFFFFSFSTY